MTAPDAYTTMSAIDHDSENEAMARVALAAATPLVLAEDTRYAVRDFDGNVLDRDLWNLGEPEADPRQEDRHRQGVRRHELRRVLAQARPGRPGRDLRRPLRARDRRAPQRERA